MKNRSAVILLLCLTSIVSAGMNNAAQAQQARASQPSTALNGAKCPAFVTVSGAVRAPARLELRRRVRLYEALAVVGGLTEMATSKIQITHAAPQDLECDGGATDKSPESLVESFDLTEHLLGSEKANPYLRPGDIVNVQEAGVAYIIGGVLRPQSIILRGPTTITQAIALAGGLRPGTGADRIYIYRRSPKDATLTNIHIDFKAIKKRRAEDLLLQPYDIIEVRDRRLHVRPPQIFPVKPEAIRHGTRVVY
ncbi:MAG TPA: SLBB domain-containing protein [Pyrinomonadaceae bacterium]|jgi:protein involved in polysaccharide export with SLBB domain